MTLPVESHVLLCKTQNAVRLGKLKPNNFQL